MVEFLDFETCKNSVLLFALLCSQNQSSVTVFALRWLHLSRKRFLIFLVKFGKIGIKSWFLNIHGKVFDIVVGIFSAVKFLKFLFG